MSDAQSSILVVCTGNICRSPMAERLLRRGLEQRGVDDIHVHSAGTGPIVGEPMTPEMEQLVRAHGGEPSGHAARALVKEMVDDATLVLALTRRHRGQIASLLPRATRYTFTLREMERLLGELPNGVPGKTPVERLKAMPATAAAQRGMVPVHDPAADDVIDPFRQGNEVYQRAAREIVPAVQAILNALAPEAMR